MSLLLDALKKAADDKEKASRGEVSEASADPQTADNLSADKIAVTVTGSREEELSLQQITDDPNEDGMAAEPELSLTEDVPATDDLSEDLLNKPVASDVTVAAIDDSAVAGDTVSDNAASQQGINRKPRDAHKRASAYTVSDAGLSLLIDKTNRDVKRKKIVAMLAIATISLAILLFGGFYYYTDMQHEIANIERQHQVALQTMQIKSNREKTPDQSAIIRNLVSDRALEEKVEYAKAQIAKDKPASNRQLKAPATHYQKTDKSALSIQKSNKSDPVGETLDQAWLAYESSNYSEAKRLYQSVLQTEANNRDAQLGLGAIAVQQNDRQRASRIYQALLQQDPLDPVATAALAALHDDTASLQDNTEHMLALLQKNPDAPELNFSVGNNFAQQDRWQSAQQYYFRAWQLDADNADYIFNLAVSMDQLGKPQQAIAFYRDSLDKANGRTVSFSLAAVQKRIDELSGQ